MANNNNNIGGGGGGEDLYDEFGNYIGPDLESSSSSSEESSDDEEDEDEEEEEEEDEEDDDEGKQRSSSSSAIGGGGGGGGVVASASGGTAANDDDETSDVSDVDMADNTTTTTTAALARVDNSEEVITAQGEGGEEEEETETTAPESNAIVLHEDKVHYPSASEIYGPNVRTVVLDEDAMELETPIVEPVKTRVFSLVQDDIVDVDVDVDVDVVGDGDGDADADDADDDDETKTKKKKKSKKSKKKSIVEQKQQYLLTSDVYLTTLMSNETTLTRRGFTLCGHLHCGKTSFVDMLIEEQMIHNHPDSFGTRASVEAYWDTAGGDGGGINGGGGRGNGRGNGGNREDDNSRKRNHTKSGPRITDTLLSEQYRQMSLKMTPLSICLPNTKGKHYLTTIMDCPGHVNFHDENVASMRVSDGVVIMVDAIEGIMIHTEMLIRHAILVDGLNICLVINKIDRLILELKLPPNDAYYKLLHIIDSVNELIDGVILSASGGGGGRSTTKKKSNKSNNNRNSSSRSRRRHRPSLHPCRGNSLHPCRGNVCFASSLHGWSFTLESFAQHYADSTDLSTLGNNLTINEFTKRLWGNCFYDYKSNTFKRRAADCTPSPSSSPSMMKPRRTFVEFILEPLYKLYGLCLGENEVSVNKALRNLGILLSKDLLRSSARPLLRASLKRFFGPSTGFVDMIVKHIPCPAKAAARGKISRCYTGLGGLGGGGGGGDNNNINTKQSKIVSNMIQCNPRRQNGILMIHCVKLFASPNGKSFSTFGRIYSGCIKPGDRVKVLGESYSPDDDEDMTLCTIKSISIPQGRRKIDINLATAGNWILIDGIDHAISKTATVTNVGVVVGGGGGFVPAEEGEEVVRGTNEEEEEQEEEEVRIFAPLKFPEAGNEAVMKLAVEPINPSELPKMIEGLRCISRSYPMSQTRVEESGEHVLFGTGELYMDCIMHDLRHVYSSTSTSTVTSSSDVNAGGGGGGGATTGGSAGVGLEVKVSDPVVAFRESVVDTSTLQCFAETPNKRNRLTMIAEPLDDGLAENLELGKVDLVNWDNKKVGRYFQTKYEWDILSARSVWAFGPSSTHGPNILLDDTLPSEVNKSRLSTIQSSIIQGFQWATREGPLCEEPLYSTKLRLLNATLAERPLHRGGGQIIPTIRRVVHSSILTATPKLMEPISRLQIQCPSDIVDMIQPLLTKRRGHVIQDMNIAGSPLSIVKAYVPVLDSFGLETDIRTYTQGQGMVHSILLDHWSIVSGDPLDSSIVLHPLEPSPPMHLARELLVKTRRRKGLNEDVRIYKYFDEEMRIEYDRHLKESENMMMMMEMDDEEQEEEEEGEEELEEDNDEDKGERT